MMEDYKIFVDNKLPLLKRLHELLCLFMPCAIDNDFLSKSHFVSVKAVYEDSEFKLILTMVKKPERSDELKRVLFNTGVLIQISSLIFPLLLSTHPIFSLLRLLVILITSGFIFISKLFFATCSSFAFILRTEGKRPLFLLRMNQKINATLFSPSLKSIKRFWKYISEPYIECGLSVVCDAFQVVGRDIKVSLRTQSHISSNNESMIAAMGGCSGENHEHSHLGKNKKKKKKKCSSFEPSHYFTIGGKTLNFELKETNLSSIYLKLKYFVEKYGSNSKGCDRKDHKAFTFIAADFSEVRLYNYSEKKSLGVAVEVSILYSDYKSWEGLITVKVSRLDLFASLDNDDDNDRVTLSDLSLVYTSVNEVSLVKQPHDKSCATNKTSSDTGFIDLRCQRIEVVITAEYLDLALRSIKILRYFSFLFESLYSKLSCRLRVAVNFPHLSIKIVHMCAAASDVTNIGESCHSTYGGTKDNSMGTICNDDTDVESRSSNCGKDTDIADIEDDFKVLKDNSDSHIVYFVSIIAFRDCCFQNNEGSIVSIGGQINHYFGEDSSSDISSLNSFANSMSIVEHEVLWYPS